MNDTDHLAQVFRRSVVLRIKPKLFVRLRGDVPTREVLLRSANGQQQAAALFRVLFSRMRLYRAQNVFAHGQLRAISDTAGNPPWGSSSFSPKRNLQDDRQPLQMSLLGSSVGTSSSSNICLPV